jgi:hypothetical protein
MADGWMLRLLYEMGSRVSDYFCPVLPACSWLCSYMHNDPGLLGGQVCAVMGVEGSHGPSTVAKK